MHTLQDCIISCWDCRNECQKTLFNHCLQQGGEHVNADHVKIMMDCIQVCQIAADAMTRNSPLHKNICELCAKICDACAKSCAAINDAHMQHCAQVCTQCAQVCRNMG